MFKDKMDFKAAFRRYYVFSKPGIVYANTLTAIAGYLFASAFDIDFVVLLGLVAGIALLIAGACAYNNYLDRGIDAVMERTKKRGTVTGEISTSAALLYATTMTITGLGLLALTQNTITLVLSVTALFAYVVLYGIGKRKTVHGTLIGCISGALPLVIGYTAYTSRVDVVAVLLFALMTAWQMAHFYGIALYRLDDYKSAKIPVMPAVYGVKTTKIQVLLYIVLFIAITICLIFVSEIGVIAGGVLAVLGVVWLVRVIRAYNLPAAKWGLKAFLFSLTVMLAMCASLSAGPLLV